MRRALAALLASSLALAACSSSGTGGAPSSGSTASAPSGGTTVSAAEKLTNMVVTSLQRTTSAHLDIDAGSLLGMISGDVTLDNAETKDSHLVVDQGGSRYEVITVGGTSYAKLPAGHNTTGKPWAKVSADSSNEFVRAFAGTLTLINAAISLDQITQLLATGTTAVTDVGRTTLSGVGTTERYRLTLDLSKATGDLAGALALGVDGPVTVDLWLADGRPVKITAPLAGSDLVVQISKYGAPVSIQAPPASEVAE